MMYTYACIKWAYFNGVSSNVLFKDGFLLKITNFHIHLYFIATRTVFIQLCSCGSYRQLNSVIYHNNYILKSSKTYFTGQSQRYLVLTGNLKKCVKTNLLNIIFDQGCVVMSSKHNTDSFIRSIYHNICMIIALNIVYEMY